MHILTSHDQAVVSGGILLGKFLYIAAPMIGMTLKGVLICWESNLNYKQLIPAISNTAAFSLVGAGIGHIAYDQSEIGGMLGGIASVVFNRHYGYDRLS